MNIGTVAISYEVLFSTKLSIKAASNAVYFTPRILMKFLLKVEKTAIIDSLSQVDQSISFSGINGK